MPIKTAAQIQAEKEAALKQGAEIYYKSAQQMYADATKMRQEASKVSQVVVPDWFRQTGIPIVFAGHYHTPHIFMTCAVKFHTIVWDHNYGQGAPEFGWKAVDRPPIMVDVRIPIHLALQDSKTGVVFNGQGIMASQTMPHSHPGGAECFVGISGDNYLKTFKDYEVLRGRIANHLGGANLASLASHWGDWSEELKACFPPKLAKVIAAESKKWQDPNVIYGAAKVKPDFTKQELADLTWGDNVDDNGF